MWLQKLWYKTLSLVFGFAAFGFGFAMVAVILLAGHSLAENRRMDTPYNRGATHRVGNRLPNFAELAWGTKDC
jgi:hypothetical protein